MSQAQLTLHYAHKLGLLRLYSRCPQGRGGMETGISSAGPRCLCTNKKKPFRNQSVFDLQQQGHSRECSLAVARGAVLYYAEQAYIHAQRQNWDSARQNIEESYWLERAITKMLGKNWDHSWEGLSQLIRFAEAA